MALWRPSRAAPSWSLLRARCASLVSKCQHATSEGHTPCCTLCMHHGFHNWLQCCGQQPLSTAASDSQSLGMHSICLDEGSVILFASYCQLWHTTAHISISCKQAIFILSTVRSTQGSCTARCCPGLRSATAVAQLEHTDSDGPPAS